VISPCQSGSHDKTLNPQQLHQFWTDLIDFRWKNTLQTELFEGQQCMRFRCCVVELLNFLKFRLLGNRDKHFKGALHLQVAFASLQSGEPRGRLRFRLRSISHSSTRIPWLML
jgi:hypothetical protein